MNETIVVVTGSAPLPPDAVAQLPPSSIVLAADGALDHALAAGLTPAGLVGDLDSISPAGLEWAERHATIERHPPDKDATDTELALAVAVGFDPARLILLSGGGDRLDHTLAAIGALGHPSLTSIPEIDGWWGEQRFHVAHGPGRMALDVTPGTTVSVLALHGAATGVTITGVRWPLDHDDLGAAVGHGVSNEAIDEHVELSLTSGVLTVFVVHPEDPPPPDTTAETIG